MDNAFAMLVDQPPPKFLYGDFALLLHQLEENYSRCVKPYLRAWQLSKQQFRILRYIYERGPMEPRHIVAVCAIPSPSLTGILVRMEKLKLIDRQRMPQDQRRLLIKLTEKSRALLCKVIPEVNAACVNLQSQLSPDFISNFASQARQLMDALQKLALIRQEAGRAQHAAFQAQAWRLRA